MLLNKEQCDVIMKEAFEGITMPEYTVDDVNRILLNRHESMQRIVKLRIVDGKSFEEINQILGYNSNYSYNIYRKFISKVRRAPSYNWHNYNPTTFDESTGIEYLELSREAYYSLHHIKVNTVGELCKYSRDELSKPRYVGKTYTDEIVEKLNILGLKLKDNMALNEEHCSIIMNEAFANTDMPEYTVDDINRILLECRPMVQEAVRLKVILGKSSNEASYIMGYSSDYYAKDLYNKFLSKVRKAPSYSWYNYSNLVLDENSSVDYLELSIRACNCLRRTGIKTIGQLCECTQSDIKKIRNAGNVVAEEISYKLSLLGFELKDDPKDSIESLIPLDTKINTDFSTTVISEMLPVIYNKCIKRTKKYGYKRACINCPYRGTGDTDCMFNLQPRAWISEE